ncbi:MAG: MopE-related protein [Myxococcota bacterium]|jgi:hypothetical protein
MLARLTLCLAVLGLAGCRSSVDPNQGRFSCAETKDCGDGFECRLQFSGGGRCFKLGECKDQETCNGADDNCDGRTDETFPEEGDACLTGEPGECAAGAVTCSVGTLGCTRTHTPIAEFCNGKDDNCDGRVDEAFDFSSDELHCGGCFQPCDAGTSCLTGRCLETACDDGIDNDLNSLTDCDDDTCFGQPCVTPMPPTHRCGAVVPDAGPDGGADAGADGGTEDGGADAGLVRGCFAPETDCSNGFDDDGDRLVDCADLDCDGRVCFSGTVCAALACPGPG